jgi:SAM-dependent methyltransferase
MGWNWNIKHKVRTKDQAPVFGEQTSEEYWARHNVTNHVTFKDATESLRYLDWRNDQYIGYIDLLPVRGHDKETILDFGCGPGNDLVGFLTYSRPARLVGADVSGPSLEEARSRLELHGADFELIKLSESTGALPFADGEFDYIHCSGVLMCTREPDRIFVRV